MLTELLGKIIHKEPKKVYDKKSPFYGQAYYKLKVLTEDQEKHAFFAYPNLVTPPLEKPLSTAKYNQKRKAYLALKKKESREKLKRLAISDLDLPTKLPSTWLNQPTIGLKDQSTDALRIVDQVVDHLQTVDLKKVVDWVVDIEAVVDNASLKVVDCQAVVDNSFQVVDNLSHLIQS
ncbi:8232_t:CDS:2 [Entrophospora sp. SA101]|nr:8232_t:CDS:2 [Entrophospora sp. SA101]